MTQDMEPKPVLPIDSYETKKLRAMSEVTSSFSVETPPSPRDFFFGSELGQGSYAKVYHAKLKNKSALDFAVKVMDQNFIRRENKTAFVLTERKVMTRLRHPFIVRFYCSFRDSQSLYLVMELCLGGNLLSLIRERMRENEANGISDLACCLELTQFYMAELVTAIEYLHSKKVVHRDLKPDNLIFRYACCHQISVFTSQFVFESGKGHLKVIDFGSAKMLIGRPAFMAETTYGTFQKICDHGGAENGEMFFPESIPAEARDLIHKLLQQDPSNRIGAGQDSSNNFCALKTHTFFYGIEWSTLSQQQPPRTPIALTALPEPHLDGANEHWAVADYFSDCGISDSTCSEFGGHTRSKSSSSWHMPCKALGALPPGEQLIKRSVVKIHKRLFKRSRQMVLTDRPRLILLSTGSGELKEDYLLTETTQVKKLSRDTLEIRCSVQAIRPIRVTDLSGNAEEWSQAILDTVHHRMGGMDGNLMQQD
uniref:3phosphoinositidedependent protein kinase putative n=1 Tax=Albugo laibachii Nc14 TaxID=890382 RepID=F0WZB5_9STRA|nr:3phosphoinositidedependent protein kinase putative [Albugo laibachii Nc14]|eukprot:CCA26833.1 3phosphoinositidedependent protein kinase putative [Albugo laibachii Nc14]